LAIRETNVDRGIITPPNTFNKTSTGLSLGEAPSLDKMRYYSLYWDKIISPVYFMNADELSDYPSIPDRLQLPHEEDFVSAGILERPAIISLGNLLSPDIMNEQLQLNFMFENYNNAAKDFMDDADTDWVMQQNGSKLILPDEHSIEKNTLRIDLANCLPVPTGMVSVHDILEFKENRKNEFEALHEYLDELYEQTLLSPDQSLASKKAMSNILRSIDNLDKVTQERFKTFTRENLSSLFNLYGAEIGKGAVMDAVAANFTGVPLPIVTVGNVIIATVKVSVQKAQIFKPASKNLKLAYLSSAQKEGLY
jgi:hypothetical protein